jgi:hypothetical protein
MAVISTSGISALQVIKSEHLLRIINALNGVTSNDIIISGQLSNGTGVAAEGRYAHAEGEKTTAGGDSSHAEGIGTVTIGLYSHAEGSGTTTTGDGSHTEGYNTQTLGDYSHAEGYFTTAAGNYQHVQGQYNRTSSAASAFIIGNGTSNTNRSNLIFASGSQFQVTGSLLVTGSTTLNNILTLVPTSSLPTGQPTGSIIVSGSGASCKPYFYNGTTWTVFF